MKVPTLNKMVKVYIDAAKIERLKCGKPSEGTVRNTLSGVRTFLRWLNDRRDKLGYERIPFDEDFPLVSIIKPKLIHKFLADLLSADVKPISALSYVTQFRQLFAKWTLPYYEDHGWKVPKFPELGGKPKTPRYIRPSAEQLLKVKEWYKALTAIQPNNHSYNLWFVATMMLEFGMRNGDIMRINQSNFLEHGGQVFLNYTPHKTEHSSGRIVKWPVHCDIWKKINNKSPTSIDMEVFSRLNKIMRSFGFTGTKGAYELRKISIDHVYQKFGAEMAVSLSGDDIKTIIHYYADPSQPNIGNVRVSDLL